MIKSFVCALGVLASPLAFGITINFEDAPTDDVIVNQYAAFGIQFEYGNAVRGGISNGDPGNWLLEGTNGPKFLGCNGTDYRNFSNNNFLTGMIFSTEVHFLSFDVSRSNGSAEGTQWNLALYDSTSNQISSINGVFGEINNWTTIQVTSDQAIAIAIFQPVGGSGFNPYGVDNITFEAVPEPVSIIGLAGLGILAARKRPNSRSIS